MNANHTCRIELDDSPYETTRPEGFTRDEERANRKVDEIVEEVVLALKHFQELSG